MSHVTGNCEIYFKPGWFRLLGYARTKDADQISTHNEMCYEWYKLTGSTLAEGAVNRRVLLPIY